MAIRDEGALREAIGSPSELVRGKLAGRLNELTRQFVERSPFVCVATARPDGGLDVSPRGDPPGFVRILDEGTLLLPEGPGDRLPGTPAKPPAGPPGPPLFLAPRGGGSLFRQRPPATLRRPPALPPRAGGGRG